MIPHFEIALLRWQKVEEIKNKIMEEFLTQNQWFIFLMIAWMLPWKGVALWKAARMRDKWWFIALLVINTLAVLEILYIFIFSKKKELN